MAKAYRAKHDVSFPRVIARSGEGDNMTEAVEGTNYPAGSIIRHDTLPRHVRERADSGDIHPALEPLEDEEADEVLEYSSAGEPEYGIFVAEHEAEAHALEAVGHHVVPQEQVLEALSAGEQHAAEYQRAVKERGLDRRVNQEFLAQERERVPDEILYGAETPSGTPHNRGPSQFEEGDEGDEGEEENESAEETPARPAPPQQQAGTEGAQAGEGQSNQTNEGQAS